MFASIRTVRTVRPVRRFLKNELFALFRQYEPFAMFALFGQYEPFAGLRRLFLDCKSVNLWNWTFKSLHFSADWVRINSLGIWTCTRASTSTKVYWRSSFSKAKKYDWSDWHREFRRFKQSGLQFLQRHSCTSMVHTKKTKIPSRRWFSFRNRWDYYFDSRCCVSKLCHWWLQPFPKTIRANHRRGFSWSWRRYESRKGLDA